MKIFISYSSRTRPVIESLAEALEVIDHTVWFDKELNREGGQHWWNVILDEIRQCEVFLYALTAHSIHSLPCKAEYGYATALNKVILPVVLSDDVVVSQLPIALQALQLVDYRQQNPKQLRGLRDTLRNLVPQPLPESLPREPDPPFAPLVQINNHLLADRLEPDMQWRLASDLENAIFEAKEPTETTRLLALFRDRSDLTLKVSRKLDRLWHDHVDPTDGVDPRNLIEETLRGPAITPPSPLPTRESKSEPKSGTIRRDAKGIEQVFVPAGTFLMGSDPAHDQDAQNDEQPAHPVRITHGFWLDRYPVTNAAFQVFIDAGGYRNRAWWTVEGWQWRNSDQMNGAPQNYKDFSDPDQPRVGISWYEAIAYAAWRNARLPTEAEWEYAARGSNGSIYPWGDQYDPARLNAEQRIGRTTPVNQYPGGASWCGAFDMAGNVWEWTADWYDGDYYSKRIKDDPRGPNSGSARVVRGGCWYYNPIIARAAYRVRFDPDLRYVTVGFRLLSSVGTGQNQ